MIEKIIDGIKYRLNEETLTAEIIQKKGYKGDFIIPETVVFKKTSYRVTRIGDQAFYECSALTSIVIPEGVTSIGAQAFFECSALTSIVIPEGVTSIGGHAFMYCSALTSIVIPASVTSIGNRFFSACTSLTSIVIPASVTSIGEKAFCVCTSLTSITFDGTIAQWKAIEFGDEWDDECPAQLVHCADGDVEIKFTKLTLEQIALLDKDLHLEVYINAEDYEDVTEFDPYQGFDFYFNKGMISFGAGFYKIPYNELEIPVCAYPKITTDLGEPIQCEIDKFIGQLVVGLMWHSRYVLDDDYTRALEKYKVPIYAYALKDADSCIISEGNRFEDFYISQLQRFATV